MPHRRYGRFSIETSREEKLLFPGSDLRKADLIDHYESIWDVVRSHLRDRPLAVERFPEGIDAEGFHQREAEPGMPDFVTTVKVDRTEGGSQDLIVADKKVTLAFLAEQGCVTIHTWLSRRDRLGHPDRMVIDLDPPDHEGFEPVREAALRCRSLFDELALPSFVGLTGSRGVHVVVPLDRAADFDAVRAFAREATALLAARHPDALSTAERREERAGRLYLDVGRNAWGRTVVAPYAVRALPGAPVATPVGWDELADPALHARSFTLRTLADRLASRGDAWAGIGRHAAGLDNARRRLERLRA